MRDLLSRGLNHCYCKNVDLTRSLSLLVALRKFVQDEKHCTIIKNQLYISRCFLEDLMSLISSARLTNKS